MPKNGAIVDFFVVGSSTFDIIARMSDAERVDIGGRHVEHLVCIPFASKSGLSAIDFSPGGSASNSVVLLKGLGSSVSLLSAVGNDEFGRIVMASLKKAGIDTASVKACGNAKTGVGIVFLSGGEKSVLVYRGANNLLGPSDVTEQAIRDSRQVFVTSLVSDLNYRLFEKTLLLARKSKTPVVFAPSIMMLNKWLPKIRKLRHSFDMVIVNYEEGCYYTGKTGIREILASLPGKVSAVMKDSDGAYASVKGKGAFHVMAVPVKVKDTSGAGDIFSSAFAHSYYGGKSIGEALRVGAAAAAMKITHKGAQFRVGRQALASFIKAHSSSLVVRRL